MIHTNSHHKINSWRWYVMQNTKHQDTQMLLIFPSCALVTCSMYIPLLSVSGDNMHMASRFGWPRSHPGVLLLPARGSWSIASGASKLMGWGKGMEWNTGIMLWICVLHIFLKHIWHISVAPLSCNYFGILIIVTLIYSPQYIKHTMDADIPGISNQYAVYLYRLFKSNDSTDCGGGFR